MNTSFDFKICCCFGIVGGGETSEHYVIFYIYPLYLPGFSLVDISSLHKTDMLIDTSVKPS